MSHPGHREASAVLHQSMVMMAYLDVAKILTAMIVVGGCRRTAALGKEIRALSSASAKGTEGETHGQRPVPQIATLRWALRRAAWGLLVLAVTVMLGAWLLYASIDPDEAAASGASEAVGTEAAKN
jgi:hypothetical protein